MSYGLQVWTATGATRVFNGSWLFKYHSTHTITAPAGGSTFRSISGFDPNTWGVQAISVTSSSDEEYARVFRVALESGGIRVYGTTVSDLTATLHVLKA